MGLEQTKNHGQIINPWFEVFLPTGCVCYSVKNADNSSAGASTFFLAGFNHVNQMAPPIRAKANIAHNTAQTMAGMNVNSAIDLASFSGALKKLVEAAGPLFGA